MPTRIEWCDETWNPTVGCTPVSPACDHCYAARMAWRLAHNPTISANDRRYYEATVTEKGWTSRIAFFEDRLTVPNHWRTPRRVFVGSMTDLFHPFVSDEILMHIFVTMTITAPQHTYLLLTKRPELMARWWKHWCGIHGRPDNIWLGVTAENQEEYHLRGPILKTLDAPVRFISCEPMLGRITMTLDPCAPDWIIVGEETGPAYRPCESRWIWNLWNEAKHFGIPYFAKRFRGNPQSPCFTEREFPVPRTGDNQ